MLYASTRSSLMSALGLRGQRLHSQLLATSKSDLQFPSTQAEPGLSTSLAELSVREMELAQVKAAEAEGAHGTGKRTNLVSSSGISFPVSDEARVAIAALATQASGNLVQLVMTPYAPPPFVFPLGLGFLLGRQGANFGSALRRKQLI